MNDLDHKDELDRAIFVDCFNPAKGIIYGLLFGIIFWVIIIGGCYATQKLSGNNKTVEQTEGTQ
jgi:hypothetical protein